MATSLALGIRGWHLRRPRDSHDQNGAMEAPVYCYTGGGTSHGTLRYPFTVLFGLRNGVMTFERRTAAIEGQPHSRNSYPQPGDAPVYRPPVPLVPRALRATSSALPLLVPTHEAATSTPPFQELKLKVFVTNDLSVAPFAFLCDH